MPFVRLFVFFGVPVFLCIVGHATGWFHWGHVFGFPFWVLSSFSVIMLLAMFSAIIFFPAGFVFLKTLKIIFYDDNTIMTIHNTSKSLEKHLKETTDLFFSIFAFFRNMFLALLEIDAKEKKSNCKGKPLILVSEDLFEKIAMIANGKFTWKRCYRCKKDKWGAYWKIIDDFKISKLLEWYGKMSLKDYRMIFLENSFEDFVCHDCARKSDLVFIGHKKRKWIFYFLLLIFFVSLGLSVEMLEYLISSVHYQIAPWMFEGDLLLMGTSSFIIWIFWSIIVWGWGT